MRFDLTDLRLFLHVAEARSLTHGAERSSLALASASARIRGMEALLGVALLKRGRRGVELTAPGRSLVEHARIILQQVERMRGDLGAHARGLKGRVHVLSNTVALSEHLPEVLASFLSANPSIDIELEERESADILAAIAAGAADLGVAADLAPAANVERFPFRADRLVIVVARSDALAGRRQVALRDVIDRDFVGLAPDSALHRHLAGHAARLGRAMQVRVHVSGFDAVCRLVAARVGIGIVPELAARRCRRSMPIAAVRLRDEWAERRLAVCAQNFAKLAAPARRLVEHLRAAAS